MTEKEDKSEKSSSSKESSFSRKSANKDTVQKTLPVRESPHLNQYLAEFVREKQLPNLKQRSQKLRAHGISFIAENKPIPTIIHQNQRSKNSRMVLYLVQMSYFLIKITIFNTVEEDGYVLIFENQISEGNFGTVFQTENPFNRDQIVAVKQIKYHYPSSVEIQSAVKEYAMMKLFAALEIGPPLVKIFGFDLVVTHEHIMFSMEKGVNIQNWIQRVSDQKQFEEHFSKLQDSLYILHMIKICHNDIKPQNIVFSPRLQKLVYIDFGFSEVRNETIGFMSFSQAKGTLMYCSDQVKDIFLTSGEGYFDTYYNDYICLKKSREQIEKTYFRNLNLYQSSDNLTNSGVFARIMQKYEENKMQCASAVVTIYLAYLIESQDLENFCVIFDENSSLFLFFEENIRKICLFFLQIEPSLILQNMFTRLYDIFLTQSMNPTSDIKKLIQKTIKPYFAAFLLHDFESMVQIDESMKDRIFFKKMLKRYSNKYEWSKMIRALDELQQPRNSQQWLDLESQDQQKLRNVFNQYKKLSYQTQKKIIDLFISAIRRRKQRILVAYQDICIFRRCINIGQFNISTEKVQKKSDHQKFLAYLSFFLRLILYIHEQQLFIQNSFLKENSMIVDIDTNNFQMLQIYVFAIQKMEQVFLKQMSPEKSMYFTKRLIKVFEKKMEECFEIKIQLQKQKINSAIPYLNRLIQNYLTVLYQIGLCGYMVSHSQMNPKDFYYFHNHIFNLRKWRKSKISADQVKLIFNKIVVLEYIEEFVSLLTFSDAIPISLAQQYLLVELYQILIKKIQEDLEIFENEHLRETFKNLLFNLFILETQTNHVMKAFYLAKYLINQNLVTEEESSIYILHVLFKKFKNSKWEKIIQKKMAGNPYSSFDTCNFSIESSLEQIERFIELNQDKTILTQIYLEKIKTLWVRCIQDESYKHKYSQKFYLMRQIMVKLINKNLPTEDFIEEYEKQLEKYQGWLSIKFDEIQKIQIWMKGMLTQEIYESKPLLQYSRQKLMNQFILQEKQQFFYFIVSQGKTIYFQQSVNKMWLKYLKYFQNLPSVSQNANRFHLQIVCNYHEHALRYASFLQQNGLSLNFQKQFTYNQKANNHTKIIESSLNSKESNILTLKQNFKTLIKYYLSFHNKNLTSNDFYMRILIALRKKSMEIEGYDKQKVISLIKEYFYLMAEKQQVIHFFLISSFAELFLYQIISVSIDELCEKYLKQSPLKYSQQLIFRKKCLKIESNNIFNGNSKTFSFCNENLKSVFCTDVYFSLWNFIRDNQCLSYSKFIGKISFQIKTLLTEKLKNIEKHSSNSQKGKIQEIHFLLIKILENSLLETNYNDSLILILLLNVSKADFQIKIEWQVLLKLSKFMMGFSYQCKSIGKQAIHHLIYRFWYTLEKTDSIIDSKMIKFKDRKIRYFLVKLLRSYQRINLVFGCQKYIENLSKTFRNISFGQIQNTIFFQKILRKLVIYFRCNLEDNSFSFIK